MAAELAPAVPAHAILDTIREPLIVPDGDLRVASANRAFSERSGLPEAEFRGRSLYEPAEGAFDVPLLRRTLEPVLLERAELDGSEVGLPICRGIAERPGHAWPASVAAVRGLGRYWFGVVESPPEA